MFYFIFINIDNLKSNSNNSKTDNKATEKNVDEKKEEDEYNKADIEHNNDDIIGRIKIDGTNINNYIVQSEDNDYYLNHNLDKEEDIAGSIFLDYRNTFSDKKLLIFGHNGRKLKTVPFHDLEKFMDKIFYDEHKYINLELDNEKSTWIIFSVMLSNKGDNTHMKITFNDEEWINHINWLKSNSLYDTNVDVGLNDRIVTLQTCNFNPENTYLLISAKEV